MGAPDFWDKGDRAQEIIAELGELKGWAEPYQDIKQKFEAAAGLLPEAVELGDEALIGELMGELDRVEEGLEELEVRRMLSGEFDKCNTFLSVNAGAGGTEACDWAAMLLRMYERWASKRGWRVEVVEAQEGEVAGLRHATLKISGEYAYGYARAERGVHRLVRISPFDAGARRHTSFASVDVWPEIDEAIEVEIPPEEIRVDTFRSSGAGGQHVNVTDSAVRVTHLPTGIVVTSQKERSQQQNRRECMAMLRSKLHQIKVQEREEKIAEMGGEKREIAWGSQIRNYVFHPYTLVKDTRTKVEKGNVQAVMDGEIDPFIQAYLKEFG